MVGGTRRTEEEGRVEESRRGPFGSLGNFYVTRTQSGAHRSVAGVGSEVAPVEGRDWTRRSVGDQRKIKGVKAGKERRSERER